jgi:hypothetical protein
MPPLRYHAGQLAIQAEAKTSHVAERLANWIGPVADFTRQADLLLFAMTNWDGSLSFSALSGAAPLVKIMDEPSVGLRQQAHTRPAQFDLRLRFHPDLAPRVSAPTRCGGLAINFANARRARINGLLQPTDQVSELVTSENFTLCRKYIAPSLPLDNTPTFGPLSCAQIALDDPWLTQTVARCETMFLASISPEGSPDVAHRGGPTGFLQLDPANQELTWPEFVGDGVFKSAGNIRATALITVLIPDLASGDAIELMGSATYQNLRSGRQQRADALEQHAEDFPVQGTICCTLHRAIRLHHFMAPRLPQVDERKITSCATVSVQAPQ